MSENGSFDGRTAIVTGGGQGIGFAICKTIVQRGGAVIIADRDEGVAQNAVAELGERAIAVTCEVTDADQVSSVLDAGVSTFGAVDIWVNNAGVTRDAMMHKMTEEQWDEVIAVHLKGTFLCTRSFARYRRDLTNVGGDAAIVNMSSIVAKSGNLGQLNYSAAKAGMVGMTKTSARELARFGVRVNAIQPGFIDTAMTRAIPENIREQRISDIPLGRPGSVEEVAKAAAFLASEEASYITGVVLEVTGGRLM